MAATAMMALCSVIIVIRNWRSPRVEASSRLQELRRFGREILPPHPLLGYVAIIIAYMLLLEPLGFNISSFLFLFVSFLYLYRKNRWKMLLLSIGSVVVIYFTFQVVFRVILPEAEWIDLSFLGLGM